MDIKRFYTPGLSINTYLVYDEKAKKGAVIDPTRDIQPYITFAQQEKIEITDILETHVHADFLSGASELKEALSNKPIIHCSSMGGKEWTPLYADHCVRDRDDFMIGSMRFEAWHTPGHTPEHLMWVVYDERRDSHIPAVAFSGDLIFVGSVGRPDLLGEEIEKQLAKDLYRSVFNRLNSLPDFLEIFPSHGAGSLCGKEIGMRHSTTLGYERRCNPWLLPQPFSPWRKHLLKEMPAAPAYFKRMKHLNIQGDQQPISLPKHRVGLGALKKQQPGLIIVDTRSPEAFANQHVEGSLHFPYTPSFAFWIASILPENQAIALIVDSQQGIPAILQSLGLVGVNHIVGLYDFPSLQKDRSLSLTSTPLLSIQSLYKRMSDYLILDVRSRSEWHSGHIHGAMHLELTAFPDSFQRLPKDRPIAVVCHSGNRASIGASFLNRHHFHAQDVQGGMEAWIAAGLSIAS